MIVITPDMRGYGDSDKPDRGYDAHTLAEVRSQLMRVKLLVLGAEDG